MKTCGELLDSEKARLKVNLNKYGDQTAEIFIKASQTVRKSNRRNTQTNESTIN